jgi:hypothetical protein
MISLSAYRPEMRLSLRRKLWKLQGFSNRAGVTRKDDGSGGGTSGCAIIWITGKKFSFCTDSKVAFGSRLKEEVFDAR